ncbi:MAG: septal ring lytic transglycosylase RlpA family protein [Deltaproteobacteria bacterium]|nr:MAG: septal ring lytic transglycosylase RlpA family protein [Deltaproteobacteria bacterium]
MPAWCAALGMILAVGAATGCSGVQVGPVPVASGGGAVPDGVDASWLEGSASWYGDRFHGRTTANGERYDMHAFTAAHRNLPFDSVVRVVRVDTRQSVVVRINDRGPFVDGRVIDLSRAAAEDIGLIRPGTAPVRIEILEWGGGRR